MMARRSFFTCFFEFPAKSFYKTANLTMKKTSIMIGDFLRKRDWSHSIVAVIVGTCALMVCLLKTVS